MGRLMSGGLIVGRSYVTYVLCREVLCREALCPVGFIRKVLCLMHPNRDRSRWNRSNQVGACQIKMEQVKQRNSLDNNFLGPKIF